MKHVILAGDSIFDNGTWVPGDPDVAEQLRGLLGPDDKVTLLAVDGDVINGVSHQLNDLPNDATHLFISVGGNDALGALRVMEMPVNKVGEGFLLFHEVRKEFEKMYQNMLSNALSYRLPTTVCTIYRPCLSHGNAIRMIGHSDIDLNSDQQQKIANTALPIINGIIRNEAISAGLPIMDLEIIFNDVSDYANDIEPSAVGGMKMAKIIKEIVNIHDFSINKTVVYKGNVAK
tara:strand:- start:2580 stop:3275 length:696 start_codon:yes stop_codon:yes gene_type:complete